jgi:hypothetical protein
VFRFSQLQENYNYYLLFICCCITIIIRWLRLTNIDIAFPMAL